MEGLKSWEYLDINTSKVIASVLKSKIVKLDGNYTKCSEYCGINRTTLNNKLNGHNPFRVIEVEKVCDYLGEDSKLEIERVLGSCVTVGENKKQENKSNFTLIDEIVVKVGTLILNLCEKPDISYVDVDVIKKLLDSYTNFIKEVGGNKNE